MDSPYFKPSCRPHVPLQKSQFVLQMFECKGIVLKRRKKHRFGYNCRYSTPLEIPGVHNDR